MTDERMLRLLAEKFERVARVREGQGRRYEGEFYTASLVLDSISAALEDTAIEIARLKQEKS